MTIGYDDAVTDGCGPTETIARTWTATDACGNVSVCTQTILVQDTTAPTITCPADAVFECDGAGNLGEIDNWLADVSASDTCSGVTITDDYAGLGDDCGDTGSATVTWTATDTCGNTATCAATVTVEDTTAPTITCPDDLPLECDGSGNSAAIAAWLELAGADDICGGAAITHDYVGLSDDCGATGAATVTWTATDACGNSAMCTATVTVSDNLPPTITCPDDLTLECPADTCTIKTGVAQGSDVCGDVTIAFADESTPGCGDTEVIARTWTVTDDCGLSVTCVQTITVQDTTAPLVTCPGDLVVECDGAGNTIDIDAWLAVASASDTCNGVTLTSDYAGLSDDCGDTGSATVTWTATDTCGNTATCSATVTVEDTTAPTITCPDDLPLECDGSGNSAAIAAWLELAGADDICGGAAITHDYVGLSDDCGATGAATVTWTATDACGNSAMCTATVTVSDNLPPAITCPDDLTLECPADTCTINTGVAEGSDVCSDVTIAFADESTPGCGDTEVIARTWTVTDDCGLSVTCVQTIAVIDATDPVIACPADVTIECTADTSSANTGVATGSDTCGDVAIDESDVSVAGCGDTEVITRTWVATDDCGNTTSCVQTVTVEDTTPPTITCPDDVTLECPADTCILATGTATGSDTCGAVEIEFEDDVTDQCGATETILRTWYAVDECGNENSCVQTIVVEDTTAPTVTCPDSATLECDGAGNTAEIALWLSMVEGADTCGDVTLTHDYTGLSDECGATGAATVTFTATDECANSATCAATIAVVDTVAPIISCPEDTVLECDGAGNVEAIADWLDLVTGDDICGDVTLTHDYAGLSDDCGATGAATVTFTATDACANSTTCAATISVVDITAPVITCPADEAFECDGAGNTAQIAAWLAAIAGSDICGSVALTHDYTGLSDECGATGSATVTFTATDDCDNETTCAATVTVVDTTDPVITCPDDEVFECDGDGNTAQIAAWLASIAGSDICGDVALTHDYTGLSDDCGATGAATVTFTATDDCDNRTTCVAIGRDRPTRSRPTITCPADLTLQCPGGHLRAGHGGGAG